LPHSSVRKEPGAERSKKPDNQQDILPLAHHFLSIYGSRLGYSTTTLSPEAVAQLLGYPWPGNIRELENSIHHALLVCAGTTLRPDDLRLPAPRPQPPVATMREQRLLH
jgi:sigma-54-specific transcriptional regulator